jgi:hypothetical protein
VEKFFEANRPHKQSGVTILISNILDFRQKSIRRENEGYFILIKGIIHQETIPILKHIYVKHRGTKLCLKKKH